MVDWRLTREQYESLVPLYERSCMAVRMDACSRGMTSREFVVANGILMEKGLCGPMRFSCGHCVMWLLKTVHTILTVPENGEWFDMYIVK